MPDTPAPVPPVPEPVKEPLFRWPPDRKVWAGGLAGILAWVLLSVLRYFDLDMQPILISMLGESAPNLQTLLTGFIIAFVSYVVPPSLRDKVDRVNNAIVMIANASPENHTTAQIVDKDKSNQVAKANIASGAIAPEVVEELNLPKDGWQSFLRVRA